MATLNYFQRYKRVSICGLLLVFLCFSSIVQAISEDAQVDRSNTVTPQDYGEILRLADEVKSSDPVRFGKLLSSLKNDQINLSKAQLNYLNYLITYELTFNGKLEQALAHSKLLLQDDVSEVLQLRTHIINTNIYALSRNWQDGLSSLLSIIQKLPEINDRNIYEQALAVIAIFYNQLGQHELALQYASTLLSNAKKYRSLCIARFLIIESKAQLGTISTEDPFISESINECKQSGETVAVSFVYTNLAKALINKSEYKQALELLVQHINYIESANYRRVLAEAYSLLAELYLSQGYDSEAKRYAEASLEKSVGVEANEPIIQAHRVLYALAQKQKNYQLALELYTKYSNLNQDYLDEVQVKHLAFQLAQHQTIQKENEIELLNEQNQLLKLQQQLVAAERENDRLFMLLSLLVIFVLVFFGFRLWRTQKRLKQLAEYDALTGLLNRGHFVEVAKSTLSYCQQTKQHAGIIMFDLDKFKSINDNFGHAAGDWALQAAAKVCLSLKREQDIVARIGGEEFCIILPSCGVFKTEQIAEKYRQALARLDTQTSGSVFAVSASFGITDTVSSGYSLERLLADADEAMYQSKRNGRDQVTIFEKTDS